jgi:hypothetical protein
VSDDITPASVMAGFWRWFGVGVLALALLAALIVGGWRAGWWFAAQNATRQSELIQNGYSNQSTLRQQVTAQLANVNQITVQIAAHPSLAGPLKAQRASVAATVCQDASEITGTPLPAQQAQWVAGNCSAGSLRPGSSDYQEATP